MDIGKICHAMIVCDICNITLYKKSNNGFVQKVRVQTSIMSANEE